MSQRIDTPRPAWKHPQPQLFAVKSEAPTCLVDPSLEYTDPTPDIHALFVQFNNCFFEGRLGAVEVKWSSRLTKTVGVCADGGNGLCCIRLSEPLLKLRPRKDLVETLLHEMIHAYLMVYKKITEDNDHGPEFCKYMRRINAIAGTAVSVCHNFHEEVHFYQQHWFRCDGPCRQRRPCIASKRHKRCPPWPRDAYWQQHRDLCGGTFRKVRAPEGCGKGSNKE